eukprot:CAMPEP_0172541046 /NCGR_PEP_ID=MMETSP1067-20121228/11935_1 /TAXON_ID=265564 ORGANISM="Thalassiosira punctigera, Strain Tpunct2005C2" /NCGR_SAMPLE_ID=MMETSP1067 /ASSEMBLY_ACC=CAM_ASM_000444 /LENGTH=654 /DNA_ID=CAMNT_0013327015 /DNA_START=30 /DNA_END=1991 /DNA_ORIENTATION=-
MEDPRFPRSHLPDRIVECKLVTDERLVSVVTVRDGFATDDDMENQFVFHPRVRMKNQNQTVPMRLFVARRELTREYHSSTNGYICGVCNKNLVGRHSIKMHFATGKCLTIKDGKKERNIQRIKAIEKAAFSGSSHNLLRDFHGVKKPPSSSAPAFFGNPHKIKEHKLHKMPSWLVFNADRSPMYPEIYVSLEFRRGSQNRNHFNRIKEEEGYVPSRERVRLRRSNRGELLKQIRVHSAVSQMNGKRCSLEKQRAQVDASPWCDEFLTADDDMAGNDEHNDGRDQDCTITVSEGVGVSITNQDQKKRPQGSPPKKFELLNNKIAPLCKMNGSDAERGIEEDDENQSLSRQSIVKATPPCQGDDLEASFESDVKRNKLCSITTKSQPSLTMKGQGCLSQANHQFESKKEDKTKKIYTCPHCEKTFTSKSGRKYHLDKKVCQQLMEPKQVKNEACVHCGKFFSSVGRLQLHLRTNACQHHSAKGGGSSRKRAKTEKSSMDQINENAKRIRSSPKYEICKSESDHESGSGFVDDELKEKKEQNRKEKSDSEACFGNPHKIKYHKLHKMPPWLVFHGHRSSMYPEIYVSMEFRRGSQNRNYFERLKDEEGHVPKGEKMRQRRKIYRQQSKRKRSRMKDPGENPKYCITAHAVTAKRKMY